MGRKKKEEVEQARCYFYASKALIRQVEEKAKEFRKPKNTLIVEAIIERLEQLDGFSLDERLHNLEQQVAMLWRKREIEERRRFRSE